MEMKDRIKILYFSNDECNVCKALKPKIKEIADDFEIDFQYINIDKEKNLTSKYLIFSIPVILVTLDGKEIKRYNRNINLQKLFCMLKRYKNLIG